MRPLTLTILAASALAACAKAPDGDGARIRSWTLEDATMTPADHSLRHPEDGVALPGGALVVADRLYGLIALSPDGGQRPFGDLASVGYDAADAEHPGGSNGVAMAPDGSHVLMADAFTGAIYRVDVASEKTSLVYSHEFGVNTAVSDSSGAIWFTQSTENNGPDSEARSFAPVDIPMTDGAVFRIPPVTGNNPAPLAELKVSGIRYANGIVIDEARGALYVAETMADRVMRYLVDIATGALGESAMLAAIPTPDNVELDDAGWLWAVDVIGNEVFVIDPDSGETHSVFHAVTPKSEAVMAEWRRRTESGEARLPLIGPDLWAPMPGMLTGVILPPGATATGGGPVYLGNLGDALVRLEAKAE